MAAYYKVDVVLNSQAVSVGLPSPQSVSVTLPLVGPAGPQGAAGAAGATGAQGPQGVPGTGLEVLTTQGDLLYQGASTGQRLPIGTSNQVLKVVGGIPAWANESGAVSSVAGRTGAVTLAVADVADAVATSDARLSDARTPSSTLAHASTHHTGGTDALAPNNIGAAWAQTASTQGITGDTVLTAGRNLRIGVGSTSTITANITLPFTGNQAGDTITLVAVSVGPPFSSTYTIRLAGQFDGGGDPVGYSNLATINALGQSFTFVSDGSASGWSLRSVDTHTHAAADITSGTLDVARLPVGTGSTNVIAPTIVDAKGDLIVGSAADTVARLAVGGTNGHVLTVDSAETLGLKWAAAAGGITAVGSTVADILSVSGSDLVADDLGADKLYGWAESAGKAIGYTIGSGLETDTTTLKTKITSDPTGITGADAITNIMSLTQAEYDAIGSPNAATLFLITDP